MGSCSSSGKGGASGGGRYISSDKTLTRGEEPIQAELQGVNGSYDGFVLSAKTDGNGNLTLETAPATIRWSDGKEYAQWDVANGITDIGAGDGVRSTGINWDAVQTVSGETYIVRKLMREKGFEFDKTSSTWEKPNQTSKVTSNSINKMSRSQLESHVKKSFLEYATKSRGMSESEANKLWDSQSKNYTTDTLKAYLQKNMKQRF